MTLGLETALAGEVTGVAMCWRLTRPDGVAIGLTSHDRDIVLDGLRFRSAPGMTPSAVSQSSALSTDSMDVEGALVSSAVSAFDLEGGRWDGARVELLACDWEQPELGFVPILTGEIGQVTRPLAGTGGGFRVELLSDVARLQRAAPLRLAPMCRAELGDGRCGVSLEGRRLQLSVARAEGERIELMAPIVEPQLYAGGRMRFVTGPACGIDRRVIAAAAMDLQLEQAVPPGELAGSTIWLQEGCDKRLATCSGRFGNALAFDGEPHVPGMDALLRYVEG